MCIANNKDITKHVLNSYKFCDCITYKITFILLLIFGYIGAIIAWIFTASSAIAIVWDVIYTLCCIIGTIGLILNNYLTFIVFLCAYLVDVLIALIAIFVLATADDISAISGDANISRGVLIAAFVFFTIAQSLLSILLIKIIRDIQSQTAVGLPSDANNNSSNNNNSGVDV